MTQVLRCGSCFFGKMIVQDVTKRMCHGAPPTAMQVPAPNGSITMRMSRPVVNVTDEACALYRERTNTETKTDSDAIAALRQQLPGAQAN